MGDTQVGRQHEALALPSDGAPGRRPGMQLVAERPRGPRPAEVRPPRHHPVVKRAHNVCLSLPHMSR